MLDPRRNVGGLRLSIEERWLPVVEMHAAQLRAQLRADVRRLRLRRRRRRDVPPGRWPTDMPHEYTVREKAAAVGPEAEFVSMAEAIREHGYRQAWRKGGKRFSYLNLDGRRYWTMGFPVDSHPLSALFGRIRMEVT